MRVTMVKKILASGEPCRKCAQAEETLRRRGRWDRIDEVVVADERDPGSPGWTLAERHGVEVAPFFLVEGEAGTEVFTSVIKLLKGPLKEAPPASAALGSAAGAVEAALADTRGSDHPRDLVRWALSRYGADCAIAFSGAEDVVLIHMAAETGLPFSVFTLDTGRLHAETYRFIEEVRERYDAPIEVMFPDPAGVQELVLSKGLFSFFEDGHKECCGIRKVEPLRRALKTRRAWITGQRRDQSPGTRAEVPRVQVDAGFEGVDGPLVKLNPLADWTSDHVWAYIRHHEVPHNALHARGFKSIGCEPCTRAILPGEHERAGRWWWEEATKKECGLHLPPPE